MHLGGSSIENAPAFIQATLVQASRHNYGSLRVPPARRSFETRPHSLFIQSVGAILRLKGMCSEFPLMMCARECQKHE